jgi:hypothetical protein
VTSGQAATSGTLTGTTVFKLTVTNLAGANVTATATANIVQDGFVSVDQMKQRTAAGDAGQTPSRVGGSEHSPLKRHFAFNV